MKICFHKPFRISIKDKNDGQIFHIGFFNTSDYEFEYRFEKFDKGFVFEVNYGYFGFRFNL